MKTSDLWVSCLFLLKKISSLIKEVIPNPFFEKIVGYNLFAVGDKVKFVVKCNIEKRGKQK